MTLLYPSALVLLLVLVSPLSRCLGAESGDAPMLDALLQNYAFKAFDYPRTGVVFDGTVPSNLSGITVSGMRLKTGSLFKRGVGSFKEFEIPKGVVLQPYVERIVVVYQNLGNWSTVYYPLPGFTYLAPVLGLLTYDARDLSATNLPELDMTASQSPVKIHFLDVKAVPVGSMPRCVLFDTQGVVNFSAVVSENTCLATKQGHFSLVVKAIAPPPGSEAPAPAPPPPPPPPPVSHKKEKEKMNMNMKRTWIFVGAVVGGILVLILLGMLLAWLRKYQGRRKMAKMEKASESGEALKMTTLGRAKAPVAMVTRTQPSLEREYAP